MKGCCGYAGIALAPDKQVQDHGSEWVCIPRDQCSCHPKQPSSQLRICPAGFVALSPK